jgi:streptomycin 6-kinase
MVENLNFDRERITCWAFAQSVLSAWWSFEDEGHGWEDSIAFAEIMERLL